MWIDTNSTVTLILNIMLILFIHGGTVYVAMRLPATYLARDHWWAKEQKFERGGRWYERWFRVTQWKDRLPDGGAWTKGGFKKAHLQRRDREYLNQFVLETKRGEWTHWLGFGVWPLFVIWNPWQGALILFLYSIIAHLPCIIVQRYNRLRLQRILDRTSASHAG
jgi:glycosyl-4,4'-diaponeurosporenoate acyltransferase